tara:strand:+ start:551 stop:904 length:354 start_codon:yes stop_codon:yes gene_type:complete
MEDKKYLIEERTFDFALQIIALYQKLIDQKEYVLSKQLLKAGTSIGANVAEAGAAQSKRDFIAKMAISSKEARETKYWLRLYEKSDLVDIDMTKELKEIQNIINIITKIVKTSQGNL